MPSPKISKREFLKQSLTSAAGLAIGLSGLNLLGENKNKIKNMLLTENDKPWKWSKEAFNYSKQNDKSVVCLLCPNGCALKPGNTGACHTRRNYDGKLYSIAYGNPCALHIDPIEKKPLFHFLPKSTSFSLATAGCNLHCMNCQNWEISQTGPEETTNEDLMPEQVVDSCIKAGCKSISYTYSDPIAYYEYTLDTSKIARKKGIKNIFISNGYIRETPLLELSKYIDAANINLKSFKDEIYNKLNGGKLQPVLDTLKNLKSAGVWLEITNLIVPQYTDDLPMIRNMCKWLVKNGLEECPLHFSRFTPMYKLTYLPYTPVATLDDALKIAEEEGIKYVYIGNVPAHKAENTYCPYCKKMLIERKGFSILSNNIDKGNCKFCKKKIAGIWS